MDNVISIMKDFQHAEASRKAYESEWEKYMSMYLVKWTASRLNTRSKTVVPKVHTIVETIVSNIRRYFLNQARPLIAADAWHPDSEMSADRAATLIDYQFYKSKVLWKMSLAVLQMIVFGTGIIEYFYEVKPTYHMSPFGPMEIPEGVPNIQPVSIFNWYPDPYASDVTHMTFAFKRAFVSPRWLKTQAENFENLDQLHLDDDMASFNRLDPFDVSYYRRQHGIELLTYYTRDAIYTIADRNVLIRSEENSYGALPFILGKYSQHPQFNLYGIGAIQPIATSQQELDIKRSQRTDNLDLSAFGMLAYQRNSLDKVSDLIPRPGGVVPVRRIGDISPISFPDVTGNNFNEEQNIKMEMEGDSGATDLVGGGTPSPSQERMTAREADIRFTGASARGEDVLARVAEEVILPTANAFRQMNRLFGTQFTVPIEDPLAQQKQFVTMTPYDLIGDYDLKLTVDYQRASTQVEAEKALTLFNTLVGHPMVNQVQLLLRYLQKAEVPNPASYIIPDAFMGPPPIAP